MTIRVEHEGDRAIIMRCEECGNNGTMTIQFQFRRGWRPSSGVYFALCDVHWEELLLKLQARPVPGPKLPERIVEAAARFAIDGGFRYDEDGRRINGPGGKPVLGSAREAKIITPDRKPCVKGEQCEGDGFIGDLAYEYQLPSGEEGLVCHPCNDAWAAARRGPCKCCPKCAGAPCDGRLLSGICDEQPCTCHLVDSVIDRIFEGVALKDIPVPPPYDQIEAWFEGRGWKGAELDRMTVNTQRVIIMRQRVKKLQNNLFVPTADKEALETLRVALLHDPMPYRPDHVVKLTSPIVKKAGEATADEDRPHALIDGQIVFANKPDPQSGEETE